MKGGIPHARGIAEQDDHSATLALDDIVKRRSMLLLRLGEARNKLFLVLGQNQAVEWLRVRLSDLRQGTLEGIVYELGCPLYC